ncbi:MAG TPA: transcriptional repressor [Devosia sp.]|nr:transcriptional repressor [Devosia sp.]
MSRQKTLTRNQFLVLDVLKEEEKPLSAYDILDRLRDEGLKAPLQIYRALAALIGRGHAHRLESLNAYVACAGEQCQRNGLAAFAICKACGGVTEFSDFVLRQRLEGWAEREGFRAVSPVVELHGTCAACVLES